MAEYIFQEGETSPCLTIVNEGPPTSRAFSVSYVYGECSGASHCMLSTLIIDKTPACSFTIYFRYPCLHQVARLSLHTSTISQFWITVCHVTCYKAMRYVILPTDSVLLGLDTLRTLTAVLRFNAGNSSEQLCIPGLLSGRNNGIACEPDIVGTVRLVNKTLIATTEPATATVRIRDNDCK